MSHITPRIVLDLRIFAVFLVLAGLADHVTQAHAAPAAGAAAAAALMAPKYGPATRATFTAPYGSTRSLPVGWAPDTYHFYGATMFYVDRGGTYWAAARNDVWVPYRR